MRGKKFWAWLLTAALLLGMLPVPAMAAGPDGDASYCPHHTEHTPECGYIAPTGAEPCQHEHTAECWREETVCVHTHTEDCYSDGVLPVEGEEKDADACAHVCTEESRCVTLVPDCQHEHDSACGYAPADPGQPCGYICRICPVQAMIDALPNAEDITASDRASVEEQLAAIDEARMELTDEETDQLDTARYQALVSALSALDGQAGADVPMLTETQSSISYLDCDASGQNWTTKTCPSATVVESGTTTTTWNSGWYVVNGEVTVSDRITVSGTAYLILEDGCHLDAQNGISVQDGNELTIYAQSAGGNMGKLTAKGSDSRAGIGGDQDVSGGTITINGGTINATGSGDGAGIGGGYHGSGGIITINGGNITATGGHHNYLGCAGIGGGYTGSGGTITINGGTVNASGYGNGAGIGGGRAGGNCGTITINGGIIIATGSASGMAQGGAGIGCGGEWGSSGGSGTITITGGVVIAHNSSTEGSHAIGPGDGGGEAPTVEKTGGLIIELNYLNTGNKLNGTLFSNTTITSDITIPGGTVVTIPEGKTLTIADGVTVTNNGTIENGGTIINYGTIEGNSVSGTGSIKIGVKATFDATGGDISEAEKTMYFVSGSKYGELPTPTREDYTFSGWYTAAIGGTRVSSETIVSSQSDHTIYAHWRLTSAVNVTFSGDLTYGGSLTITAAITRANGAPPADSTELNTVEFYIDAVRNTNYIDTVSVSDNTVTLTVNLIYPAWKPGAHTIYAVFGGSTTMANSTGSGMVTIAKATPAVTMTPASNLTYTGSARELISAGSTTGGTIQYSLAEYGEYSTTIPKGIDAKTHTVYYKVVGDDYYNDVAAKNVDVTIGKASNSITSLTCDNIVFGGTPDPSATASFGTPTAFTYSDSENGTYGAWNIQNPKGTWYVKASVEGTDNYEGAEKVISFSVTAEREPTPNASINYTNETLTNLAAGADYSITPAGGAAVAVTAGVDGTVAIREDWFGKTLSIVKPARDGNYSDSETQSLSIPARPDAPATPLTLTKTADSITITNTYPGCEFSADGTSWQDSGAFTGLTAGMEYPVQVRVKATANSFKSASMTQAVTTTAADGSTTVKPGESVTTGGGTITNDGNKTTIESGGTTTTVTPGNNVAVNGDGAVTVPGGSTVQTGNGPEITLPSGGTVGGDGGVTVPSGGSVQVGDTTITPPNGGEVKPKNDGTVDVPGGSTVQTGSGPEITVGPGNGGTVGGDGGVTVPDGGSVQVGDTTITPPNGGEVKPTGGGVTVPGGSTVQTGSGPEITVGPGNGGTVGGDGGVTVPSGGSVQVGDTTITLPSGGGTVTPAPGGNVTIPGGSTVTKGDGTTTEVPSGGGSVNPDTGEITLNTHTVTFDSQGGSAVPQAIVTHGGKLSAPTANPTRSGYNFGGWYKESACTTEWNFDTDTVTGNITLYAKWTAVLPDTYTVAFNSQGGSAVSSQTVTAGGKVTKPSDPTRNGYNFGGWYKDSGYTVAWNFNTDTVTENITLYAKWTAKPTSGGGGGTYTPPTYPPTVEKPSEGGTVTVSPSRPSAGDKVTVRPKPDSGYEVENVIVTDRNGKPVTVTENSDGTYTFTQPTGTVKVEVSYKPTETTPVETVWNNPFTDISESAWYYDALRYVSENGLMNGYSNGMFGPNDYLSRAQLAQILFNKEGRPGVNYLLQFGDVSNDAWYTEAVRWAASQGIVGGYGDGRFGPSDNITREQLAVMFWRYAGSPAATNKELHFADIDGASGYALDALRWAVENGILNGYGDGRLGPNGLATRAQVAQMLKNFFEN